MTKKELKALTARQIAEMHICPNCGGPVERTSKRGAAPAYCSRECLTSKRTADFSDGSAIIRFAKAWREARGQGDVGKASFAAMVECLDAMLERDRKQGRPSALYAAAVTLNSGTKYKDRRAA